MKHKGSGPKRHGRHQDGRHHVHPKAALKTRGAPSHSAKRRHPRAGLTPRGPKTCPMCGAAVADLKRHIQERHDDPASHPHD